MNVDGLVAHIEGMSEQLKGAEPLMCILEHRSLCLLERGFGEPALSHVCYCNYYSLISAALNSGLKGQTLMYEARCCVAKIVL